MAKSASKAKTRVKNAGSKTKAETHKGADTETAKSRKQIDFLRQTVPAWKLVDEGSRIRREWQTKDFDSALKFIDRVGALAQVADHHPDLHLVDFRDVTIELTTHDAGGLTDNDFLLAAQIDHLPVKLKK